MKFYFPDPALNIVQARSTFDLAGLSMNPHIDRFSFIPDPTSLYNMRVGELLKEDLGHTRQFQGKIMSGGGGMGY